MSKSPWIVPFACLSLSALGLACASKRTLEDAATASVRPIFPRVEYRENPLGIDETSPRLSWMLEAVDPAARGLAQTAWQVLVASSPEALEDLQGDLWDSGKIAGEDSIQVVYAGKPLASRVRAWWKVRVWDEGGRPSAWSPTAHWTMGLLEPQDWRARWIGIASRDEAPASLDLHGGSWIWHPEGKPAEGAPVGRRFFRKRVDLPEGLVPSKAAIQVTADNGFTVYLNGRKLGTGGNFHSLYPFDVTEDLKASGNVLAAEVDNLGDSPNPAGFLALLTIEAEGREPVHVPSDASWRSAMESAEGWMLPAFDDSGWSLAQVLGAAGMVPWGALSGPESRALPATLCRREFELPRPVKSATAYVSGLGLFDLELNGARVGDTVLQPALTEYTKRVPYVTFDVTSSLVEGKNAIGIQLGNGRYHAPRLNVPTLTRTFGHPRLLFQLECVHFDGSTTLVVSDETWMASAEGPIRANCEYDGEEYDARRESAGWSRPGFAAPPEAKWRAADRVSAPEGRLVAQMIEPIRVEETLRPVTKSSPKPGVWIFDMGQNMVGWCRLRVSGTAGTRVSLRHSETLKSDGNLYLDNIRGALVTDVYTLRGEGTETWEPRFTYHGFRFVEVKGYPGEPPLDAIEGRVVHDSLARVGEFSSSNPLLDRIHRNIYWGVRGNYRSIPTDCPQRDERQGWLGDRSVESRGEAYLFDVAAFYAKWVQDIEDSQKETGSVPDVAPPYWPIYSDNITWPSSIVIIPGTIQEHYGDLRVISKHYAAMKKWVDYMAGFVKDGIQPRDTYGDWCVPPEEQRLIHSQDPARKTAGDLLASAYFHHDLKLMTRYAILLGKTEDAEGFRREAAALEAAFLRKFFKPEEGRFDNGSQTSSVLPLAFGLVPKSKRKAVFDRLVEKILVETKGHIGTGLVGGQWLMRTLTEGGRPDLAYRIASQEDYPSWGYMVSKDATTIWELWNGDTADPAMNSGNHVMLVGDLLIWMYECLAGIAPDPEKPAFRHVILKPQPAGDLTEVTASHRSSVGPIRSAWKVEGTRFAWSIELPPGVRGTIYLPAEEGAAILEGGRPIEEAAGIVPRERADGRAVFEIGSGRYAFESSAFRRPGA